MGGTCPPLPIDAHGNFHGIATSHQFRENCLTWLILAGVPAAHIDVKLAQLPVIDGNGERKLEVEHFALEGKTVAEIFNLVLAVSLTLSDIFLVYFCLCHYICVYSQDNSITRSSCTVLHDKNTHLLIFVSIFG